MPVDNSPGMKVMSGARALFGIVNPTDNTVNYIGIFNSVNYGVALDTQNVYILGRYSPAEIEYVGASPVSVSATGWRAIGKGPHTTSKVPLIQDLISHEYMVLAIVDRKSNQIIATIKNVRPTGYTTSINNRQLEEISVSFTGILVDDEDNVQEEAMQLLQ
jgi:hypothetical protein